MQVFFEELRADFQSRVPIMLWLLLTISLAISGPFGSYGVFSFQQRLLICLPMSAYAVSVVSLLRAFVYGVLNLRDFRRGSLLIAILACVVICPPVHALSDSLFGEATIQTPGWTELILLIGSMTLGVCALQRSIQPEGLALVEPAAAPEALPRLLERIEPEFRGRLHSISVRDHYVDVSTSQGMSSLLMRFSDAMAEVTPVEGAQVHRSHWVAWDAVETVEKEAGKLFVRLPNGVRIPVSRNHRDKLEARGLV